MSRLLVFAVVLSACNGGGDTDPDSDTDDGGAGTLRSYDPDACGTSDTVLRGVETDEDGHLAAARLEPDENWYVDRIGAELFHQPAGELLCDASLAGTMYVWVSSDANGPPVDVAPDATEGFPSEEVSGNARVIEVDTDEITVGAGDSVYVAIEMHATSGEATCIRTCAVGGSASDAYWSNAAAAPYAWQAFSEISGLEGVTPFLWATDL